MPEQQRRGVGSQLMREALRLLRERGASGCVVLGEPEYYGQKTALGPIPGAPAKPSAAGPALV